MIICIKINNDKSRVEIKYKKLKIIVKNRNCQMKYIKMLFRIYKI